MAKFSKKHYQAIAGILAKHYDDRLNLSVKTGCIAEDLADLFAGDNCCFRREQFLAVVRGERPVNSRPPRS